MEKQINRAEVLLENWKALEKELSLFGQANGSQRRELVMAQYRMIREGLDRIAVSPLSVERPHVAMLRSALDRMERSIWPNPMVRFFMKVKADLLDRPREIKKFKDMRTENIAELKKFMVEKGFGSVADRLEDVLDYMRSYVHLTISGQLEGNRTLGLTLELAINPERGYYPNGVFAYLDGPAGKIADCSFSLTANPLDVPMIVNLMQGRAVCVQQADGLGGSSDKWLQLDFREATFMRSFHADYGFDARVLLKELTTGIGMPSVYDDRLVEELRQGNQVSVFAGAPFNQRLLIEADPASKLLMVRDDRGVPLEIRGLLEKRKAFEQSIAQEMKVVQLRAGKSKGKGSEQDNGKSM
ncbi:MAG: hypothetical protein EOP49_09690 [Sphingobacteriales bacterium]|nr:MAG: hypothetical protein EOP49_09690 [Sphingobacteriales bacterium]